jgi:hypothetical protein
MDSIDQHIRCHHHAVSWIEIHHCPIIPHLMDSTKPEETL